MLSQGIQEAPSIERRCINWRAESPLIYGAKKISVTFGGGITQFTAGENAQGLVLSADPALYAAKNAGRDLFLLAKT